MKSWTHCGLPPKGGLEMSQAESQAGPVTPKVAWSLQHTAVGWWSVGLTVAIFPVAWVLMTHAIPWAVLDTALAPVLLTALIDAAAIVSLIAVFKTKERSFLVIVAAVISVLLALFATLFVGGELLGGGS